MVLCHQHHIPKINHIQHAQQLHQQIPRQHMVCHGHQNISIANIHSTCPTSIPARVLVVKV